MTEKDWDRLAAVYAREVCDIFARDRRGVIGRWLRRQRLLDRRHTAVDLGCGIGSFFRKYGPGFAGKIGTDHSRRMLQVAARLCRRQPGIEWRQANVRQLPAALHGRGDLVVCSNVITFVSLAHCRRALWEVVRTARPGGWVLLVQPALESHDAVVALETRRPPPPRGAMAVVRRDDRQQRFFTRQGATSFARAAGLHSVRVHKIWYPWIDDGIARPPRGHEPPWDWLVTGRRA
jgi:ubiquinone/menaquinone biosynthesis C-methylase UbiE